MAEGARVGGGQRPMFRFSVLVFAATALVGPAIRYATWPPSWFERTTSARIEGFVYDLVFYLWPTQPLAALAPGSRLVAFLLAVGANILMFALIGLIVGAVATRPSRLPLAYGGFCSLLLVFGLWGAGYRVEYLGVIPLVLAVLLYGIPFWLIAAQAGRQIGR